MTEPGESLEEIRDRHVLLCAQFDRNLELIDESGGTPDLSTHQVVGEDLRLLGQRMTLAATGTDNWRDLVAHSEGSSVLEYPQKQRAAVLFVISSLLEGIYGDGGQTARAGIRSSGIKLANGDRTAPLIVILESPNGKSPYLSKWIACMLPRVIGDPYYRQFYDYKD